MDVPEVTLGVPDGEVGLDDIGTTLELPAANTSSYEGGGSSATARKRERKKEQGTKVS